VVSREWVFASVFREWCPSRVGFASGVFVSGVLREAVSFASGVRKPGIGTDSIRLRQHFHQTSIERWDFEMESFAAQPVCCRRGVLAVHIRDATVERSRNLTGAT